MKKDKVSSELEKPLEALAERKTVLRRIEELVCGQVIWRYIATYQNKKLTLLLNDANISDESPVFERRDKCADDAWEKADYGRRLTDDAREVVDELYGEEFSKTEIRDAIFGRIIWPDGVIDVANWRKRFLCVFGWIWHVLATASTILLLALTLFVPGSIVAKVIVVSLLLVIYIACSGFMNSISLRAVWVWDRFRRYVADREDSNAIESRSLL